MIILVVIYFFVANHANRWKTTSTRRCNVDRSLLTWAAPLGSRYTPLAWGQMMWHVHIIRYEAYVVCLLRSIIKTIFHSVILTTIKNRSFYINNCYSRFSVCHMTHIYCFITIVIVNIEKYPMNYQPFGKLTYTRPYMITIPFKNRGGINYVCTFL